MGRATDAGLVAFCGSETRLLTFMALANARRPLTGYRVAQLTGLPQTKVYKEIRRSMLNGTIQRVTTGFILADRDLRELLQKKSRLGRPERAWQRARARDPDRIGRLYRRFELQPAPNWEGVGPVRYDVPRRRAKDELLVRRGLRPSVTHGTPGA